MWLTRRLTGRLFYCLVSLVVAAGLAHGQAPLTTVIRDVVYRADGTPASGHVVISWPAFTTGEQRAVAAGSATVELGPGGAFEISLAPNVNATPAGSYYRVVFQLDAASPSSETWSVPAIAQTTISAVRATVMPTTAAVQVASRAYVDSALAGKAASGANRDITSLSLPLVLQSGDSASVQLELGKAVFGDAGQDQVALAVRAPIATHATDFFQVQDASSGNWPFFAIAPDQNVWFNVAGKGVINGQGDVLLKSNGGNGNVQLAPNGTGTVLASSLNNVQWAGPGATPTIDQAIAACGGNPCTVHIASNYSGPEATLLTTTSTGYKVFAGSNQINVVDLRANDATVGNPGAAPLYSVQHGGRLAGQLTQFGVNRWTSGTIPDSTAGATFFNWFSGALPALGDQFGLVAVAITHDALTVGASPVRISAIDAETILDATTQDALLPDVRGVTANVLINRTAAVQGATNASAFFAGAGQNLSTSGATIANYYGFRAANSATGTARNYGFYNQGNWLTDNEKYFDVLDSTGAIHHVGYFRNTDTIDYQPLSDAGGWNWKDTLGNGLMSMTSGLIISRKDHQFAVDARPTVAGAASLGTSNDPWSNLYIGTTSTPSASILGTGAASFATLTVGGGTAITKHLSATATLDFPNTNASNCADLTITVTGAATGDTVALGVPAASVIAGGFFSAWVSAANTVTVRFCTLSNGNPASGSFRADVWKH